MNNLIFLCLILISSISQIKSWIVINLSNNTQYLEAYDAPPMAKFKRNWEENISIQTNQIKFIYQEHIRLNYGKREKATGNKLDIAIIDKEGNLITKSEIINDSNLLEIKNIEEKKQEQINATNQQHKIKLADIERIYRENLNSEEKDYKKKLQEIEESSKEIEFKHLNAFIESQKKKD